MSKDILMSIQPQWVEKILKGDKTIEVRKKFPVNYVGWVYIYCTKDRRFKYAYLHTYLTLTGKSITEPVCGNGKVVARFWCDKVDEIKVRTNHHSYKDKEFDTYSYYADELLMCDILSLGDMRFYELNDYLKGKGGYAIHISKLEIFDEPKELYKKAPQSWAWCYAGDE